MDVKRLITWVICLIGVVGVIFAGHGLYREIYGVSNSGLIQIMIGGTILGFAVLAISVAGRLLANVN